MASSFVLRVLTNKRIHGLLLHYGIILLGLLLLFIIVVLLLFYLFNFLGGNDMPGAILTLGQLISVASSKVGLDHSDVPAHRKLSLYAREKSDGIIVIPHDFERTYESYLLAIDRNIKLGLKVEGRAHIDLRQYWAYRFTVYETFMIFLPTCARFASLTKIDVIVTSTLRSYAHSLDIYRKRGYEEEDVPRRSAHYIGRAQDITLSFDCFYDEEGNFSKEALNDALMLLGAYLRAYHPTASFTVSDDKDSNHYDHIHAGR